MSIKKTNTFNYQSIASAIRLLNKKERLYQPPEMAGAVEELGRELTAITRGSSTSTTYIQFPTGSWAGITESNRIHFSPRDSNGNLIIPEFSEYENYVICVKFRVTELNRAAKRVLFGNTRNVTGDVDATPIPTIYIPSGESSIAVDLYDENDTPQAISGVGTLEADVWYYAVLSSYQISPSIGSEVFLYLYDEDGNELDSDGITRFKIKPQPTQYNKQSIGFGGLVRDSSAKAINIDISANECFVFAEGLSIWGVTNSITENFG